MSSTSVEATARAQTASAGAREESRQHGSGRSRISEVVRRISWDRSGDHEEQLLTREWLITNGLGGYASGTVSGVTTRRYHGLLIAALDAPLGRTLMLAHLSEQVRLSDGNTVRLSGDERATGVLNLFGADHLIEFRLQAGLPLWRFDIGGIVLEKRIVMPHEQNTVFVTYRLLEGKGPVRLKLMPSLHFRSHDAHVSTPLPHPFRLIEEEDRYEFTAGRDRPPLRMAIRGERTAFTIERSIVP